MVVTWKRPTSLSSEIDFGEGAGEGLAAVCGHQSGAQGIWVVKSVFSREIEMAFGAIFRFPAPSLLNFRLQQAAPSRCCGRGVGRGCKKTRGRAFFNV